MRPPVAALLPSPHQVVVRGLFLVLGLVLVALGTGLHVGVGWGPGPRDGLMTGLVEFGAPLYLARTLIEGTVLVVGWLLGGVVGVTTLVLALAVGPMVGSALPRLTLPPSPPPPADPDEERYAQAFDVDVMTAAAGVIRSRP